MFHFIQLSPISGGIFIGLILNYLLPMVVHHSENLFVLFIARVSFQVWFLGSLFLISEIKFRKSHPEEMADHPFKMPFSPYTNYLSLLFLAIVLVFMFINPETRISFYLLAWFSWSLHGDPLFYSRTQTSK